MWTRLEGTSTTSRTVVVASSASFHTHPAALPVEIVDNPGVDVTIALDGEEADAASLLEIMTLGVGHEDEITLPTDNDSANVVLDSLVEPLSRDLDKE